MWIGDAKEVKGRQEMPHVNQRQLFSEEKDYVKKQPEQSQDDSAVAGVTLDISKMAQDMYRQQVESSEGLAEAAEEMSKILIIARRIAHGDIVPATDEKKLMEYSYELYLSSKMAALLHADEKHKKYKSLFDEDEEDMQEKIRELERESVSGENGTATISETEVTVEGVTAMDE